MNNENNDLENNKIEQDTHLEEKLEDTINEEKEKLKNDNEIANKICLVALIIFAIAFIFVKYLPDYISSSLWLTYLILIIFAKVKYPKNTFATVLVILTIVLFIFAIIAMLLLTLACTLGMLSFVNLLNSSCGCNIGVV